MQFLFIAKGPCAEVRTQLYLAQNVGIISKENVENNDRKNEENICDTIKIN